MSLAESAAERSRAVVMRMYDCAATQRYDEVFDVLGVDLVVNEPPFLPYGAAYRGHDGFREMIGHVTQVLDVANMRVLRTIADGDRVIAILEMPDLATGKCVRLAEESLVRDGKVVETTLYYHDVQSLLEGTSAR